MAKNWEPMRFAGTLGYFGEIPFLGSFRWLQQWFGLSPQVAGQAVSKIPTHIKLIGEMASEVANQLRAARPDLSLSACTPTQVWQEAADGVIVLSIDAIDALREAQAPTETQPLQASEATSQVQQKVSCPLFDFSSPDINLDMWGSLDDVVMGGVSEGQLQLRSRNTPDQAATFTGIISTDNSGGFSSVRTRNFEPAFDLSGGEGICCRVKGDGQRYKFILRNSPGWDSPSYIYSFDTRADQWQTVWIPFSELVATFRARTLSNAKPFDPARVFSFQLMLSKFEVDRKLNPHFRTGPFELQLKSIEIARESQNLPWLIPASADEPSTAFLQIAGSEIPYRQFDRPNSQDANAIARAIVPFLPTAK